MLDVASECHDRTTGVDSRNKAVSVSASCEDRLASVTAIVACTAEGEGDDGCNGVCNEGDCSVDEELGDVVTVDVADAADAGDVKASSGGGEGEGAGTMVNVGTRMTAHLR